MTNTILKDIKRIIGMEDQLNSFGEWKNYWIIEEDPVVKLIEFKILLMNKNIYYTSSAKIWLE